MSADPSRPQVSGHEQHRGTICGARAADSAEADRACGSAARRSAVGVSPGLVNTGTSDTRRGCWTPEANAAFELQRRLYRMKRRTLTRARVQSQEVPEAHQVAMWTLTYAPGREWSPRHITECIKAAREQARRDGVEFRYEWVAELQTRRMRRRGELARQCLHYHVLVWMPEGYRFPLPDERGWWPHGMTRVEWARNPVGYLAKYASKGTGGEPLPKGCRISGGGGLSEVGRLEVAWWMLPRYVREQFPEQGERIRRMRGGGWLNWDTGEWIPAVPLGTGRTFSIDTPCA